MKRIFLLRAYGDFVIFLQAILRSNKIHEYTIVASVHLKPLYYALSEFKDMSKIQIQFEDFGINKGQLRLFTNRYLVHIDTVKELFALKKFIYEQPNLNGVDYVEQDIKIGLLNFLTAANFKSMIQSNAIYKNYDLFFLSESKEIASKKELLKIAIFPDARIPKRIIPINTIQKIKNTFREKVYHVEVIRFNEKIESDDLVYKDFKQLVEYLNQADFIIGADSLPVHLAQFFEKKHFMFFPEDHLVNFLTPFASRENSFGYFNHFNISL